MPNFTYRAKKGPAEIVDGAIEASNRDQAVEKISLMGLLPVSVEETSLGARASEGPPGKISSRRCRVRGRDITALCRQLASLIKSGVPILRALSIISEQTDSPGLRLILERISVDVKEGKSFSSSLEVWPQAFSAFTIAMVRAGEDSGKLQESLLRIAVYRQKQEEMLSKVRAAMAYPALMGIVGIGTIVFMFTFVLPKLTVIFAQMGQELPLPTRVVIALSVFLRQKGLYALVGLAALVAFVAKAGSQKVRRRITSVLSLKIPVFSHFLLSNELARFCRTLEILIRSGIPILKAISISVPILSNEIIKSELVRSTSDLEQGASFGKSLRKSKLFPPFMVSLIAVGEESGKLDESLAEIADTYEHECDESIKVLTSLLEPLMILGMGLIVGFIVVAMLLPIFSMNAMAR
jgi:type II secretory pathway component PulF